MSEPVANHITPLQGPQPGNSVGMLSSFLDMQQRKQALRTGQYQQQAAQAEADQAQQRNRELQAARAIMTNGIQSGKYATFDGSLDRQKMADDIQSVAPIYGQEVSGQLLSAANEILQNRKAFQELHASQKGEIGSTFGALATKADLNHSDFIDAANNLLDNNSDPAFRRMVLSNLTYIPSNASTRQLQDMARRFNIAATSPENAQAQSAPAISTMQGPNGLQPVNLNPQAPGGIAPAGNSLPQGLAPTDKPDYRSTITNIPEDAQRYAQISNDNQRARQMVALSGQVSNLADQVRTGKLSKEWTDRLAVMTQHDPTLTARQMLGKYAAQLKTLAESGASTDAERATVDAGMPNPDVMDPDAVKEAAQYIGGIGSMRMSRNNVAGEYVRRNGNTNGIRSVDDQFMQHADPFIYTYQSLPPGDERKKFLLKRFGDGEKITKPDELRQFKSQINIVKHYGG